MTKLWFKIAPATLVAFIGSAFLTDALETYPGYRAFTAAAANAGWVILICAVVVFAADLALAVVYMIRQGQTDERSGEAVTGGPLPLSLGPSMPGRSKRKALKSKRRFVSMESLADGSAPFGDRMMVLEICIALVSFFSIFLGAGLMLMRRIVILGLFPVVPGVLFYKGARSAWAEYRAAKAKVRARGPGVTNS